MSKLSHSVSVTLCSFQTDVLKITFTHAVFCDHLKLYLLTFCRFFVRRNINVTLKILTYFEQLFKPTACIYTIKLVYTLLLSLISGLSFNTDSIITSA